MRPSGLVFALALAGCETSCDDIGSSCLPDCPGDRSYDATSYYLHASFDWSSYQMTASEDISLVVGTSPIIELDAKVSVTAVHAGDFDLPFAADAGTGKLRVDTSAFSDVAFTVDYTAQPSDSLLALGPRDDDPVRGVAIYTDSEPDRGDAWLVAKHDPADRALWSVELTLPPDKDGFANGARVSDEMANGTRVVRYTLDKPLPTYLMAFAAGDLVRDDRTTGRVPLSVWHRAGLAIDSNATLDAVASAMATYESLLGPYPWDSYAVFLAPQYGGGMENATVTFNAESSGLGNVSFVLNAHELGHHWFGDWVTMHTYDDVWVKEGMATLLESEAERASRDSAALGRLFGRDMTFFPPEAVVDPSLHGLDKYTTGPYQRAAWIMTQIRSLVGEDAFWASLRKVLADHALDSVTGEQFVRAFSLDEPTVRKVLAALTTKDTMAIAVTSGPVTGGMSVTLTASDPAATLIAPIGVTVIDGAGAATPYMLAAGTPLTVTVPTGGYLAPDELDVHPSWPDSFTIADADYAKLRAVMRPASATTIATWTMRSAAQQERGLADTGLPTLSGADLTGFYPALDSNLAQRSAVLSGCSALAQLTGSEATEMSQALAPLVATPPDPRFSTSYARCGTVLPTPLATELAQLVDGVTPATAGRLDYLLSFDYGAAGFAPIAKLATTAPTLALRDRAISRLAFQASGAYSAVPAADVPAWQQFFRDRLAGVTSQTRFLSVWRGIVGLADVGALPLVAPLLHSVPMFDAVQLSVVCDAYAIAQASPSAWQAFQQATMPWDTLAPDAAAALADPSKCASARIAPPRSKVAREALRAR